MKTKLLPLFFIIVFSAMCFWVSSVQAEVRTMQFGWGSGYSFDDTYRLTIPSDYKGCRIRILPNEGSDCSAYCEIYVSAKTCSNQIACDIGVNAGETIDVTFTPNDYCSCLWDYTVGKYDYCGDGYCGTGGSYYGTCVNGQITTESCSNCSSDCGSCGPVCGNGSCESGESCSSCSSDCGSCKKSNGATCSTASECTGGYCVHGQCRSSSNYCGDSYCDSGESCSSCSSDCGSCGPVCGNGSCESGETCSSCRSDCGECKKSNGSSCYSNSECSSNYCVHMVCRASSVYCGDAHCDGGESCSSCSSDCGSCAPVLKSDGSSCSSDSECSSPYCVHGKCRSSETYCGDGYCDAIMDGNTETCSNCSSDCGSCASVLKSDGSSCSSWSECNGGWCVHGACRSASTYCGDNGCDSGESCSSCSSDCGACQAAKKADGEYCDKNEECTSGNCQNYRCCLKNKTCCLSYNNCSSEQYCSEEKYYCIPRLPDGQSCSEDSFCKSGNCKNYICCAWGQACCKNHSDCDKNDYCQQETYYCRDKWSLDSACGDYGQVMCVSGYCDPNTWKCAEKSPEAAEQVSPAPAVTTEEVVEDIIIISSRDVFLKEAEIQESFITIQNKSQKEITLGEYISIENTIPSSVDAGKLALQIFKKKLLPGETISTQGQGGEREIEKIYLSSLRQGSGGIKLKVVYFVDNRAKWAEDELSVSVSALHIQKEETASRAFNETMLLEETRGEYIFVSVEDKSLQQAAINDWQATNNQMEKAVSNLKDDFTGVIKPEIISFFETIKSLEEAKSYQEVTEASIRALAPPAIIAGFDFANLLDAIDKQKTLERGLLTHFDAQDFVKIPVYDAEGNVTGYTKAIVKEKDGKFYAVKIGDL